MGNGRTTVAANPKATECFLGMLYVLEDICVYGYITRSSQAPWCTPSITENPPATRVRIVIALDQTDEFLKDADIILVLCVFTGSLNTLLTTVHDRPDRSSRRCMPHITTRYATLFFSNLHCFPKTLARSRSQSCFLSPTNLPLCGAASIKWQLQQMLTWHRTLRNKRCLFPFTGLCESPPFTVAELRVLRISFMERLL